MKVEVKKFGISLIKMYGDNLFLQKKITHIWRVTKLDIERIELDYDTSDTGKHYAWINFQSFYK